MEGSYLGVLVLGLCCVPPVLWGQVCECRADQCGSTCMTCNTTGHCFGCQPGYYGDQCTWSPCSTLNFRCTQCSQGGTCTACSGQFITPNCTACLPGWYGSSCDMSCPSQSCLLNTCHQTTGYCLACHTGYDGHNCTDCAQGYYKQGGICQQCSSQCKDSQCNRDTGTCSKCVAGRWGNKCENKCASNCATGTCDKTAGKCFACLRGWSGMNCTSSCSSQNCRLNTCDQTTGHCLACVTGYDGDNCTECVQGFSKHNTATCSPCSAFCSTGGCDKVFGNCNGGPECVAGRWGNKCENKCSPNCATGTCDTTTGKCFPCLPGWFGMNCTSSCSSQLCLLNTCNQTTGHCLACNTGYDGDNCTGIDSSLKAEGSDQSHLAVVSGILGAGLMVTIAVLLFLCWRFRSQLMVQKPDTLTSVYADPVTAGSNAYTEPPSVALSPPDGACGNTQHEIRDPGNPYEQLRVYSNMMFDRKAHSDPEPRGTDVTTPKSTSEYVNVTLEHVYANMSSGPKTKKKPRKKKAK